MNTKAKETNGKDRYTVELKFWNDKKPERQTFKRRKDAETIYNYFVEKLDETVQYVKMFDLDKVLKNSINIR
jgi:hypothetical protein